LRSTCAIAAMAKASIAGQTKTRLVPPLSEDEAATLNTVFLRDARQHPVCRRVRQHQRRDGLRTRWLGAVLQEPPAAERWVARDRRTDVGECLQYASATLLRSGHGAVCLINSDSPTLHDLWSEWRKGAPVAIGETT
jgi:glycosyltransferase A (GT-A) superfamily protein (DUF2064 family)